MAIVKWTQECLKVIPLIPTKDDDELSGNSQVVLLPGWNMVSDGDWNNARRHILDQIARGEVIEKGQVVAGKDGAPDKLTKVNLKTFKTDEVLEIIATCNNPGSLKEWVKTETREEVRLALKGRLEEVEKKVPSKPEGQPQMKQYQI